jgi:hypothetical protein
LHDAVVQLLGDIILLGSLIGITDRQVVLGAMTRALRAFAPWFSAREVTFDEGTAEDARIDGDHAFEEGGSSFA